MAKMQYPVQLFHKHRRESALIPNEATHKKMEPKWVQEYDLHKSKGEIEWLPEGEVPWKNELGDLEKKCIEARAVRKIAHAEQAEMDKIEAKKKELLVKFADKKRKEAMEAEIKEMEAALGEKVPVYVAPKPAQVQVPEPVYAEAPKLYEEQPKKKLFRKNKVDDGS